MQRKAWPRCASAAAWVLPCASSATDQHRLVGLKFNLGRCLFGRCFVFVLQGKERGRREMVTRRRVGVVRGGPGGMGGVFFLAQKKKGSRGGENRGENVPPPRQFQAETGIPVYKWDVADY